MNGLRERFETLPAASIAERLTVREGTLSDYAALGEFHYLRHAPVTATRVIVMEDAARGVAERFERMRGEDPDLREALGSGLVDRQLAIGNRQSAVVGVLVESYPALSCVLRDRATGNRYAGWTDRAMAARLLNSEVRCISRVVVHPQWRGVGLAVRLVRHALSTATTPITEALAAMGRVHPFFELAGMAAHRRWPHAKDQRLIDALGYAGIEAWELASAKRVRERIESCGLLRRELRRWAGGRMTLEEQLDAARERLLGEPVYYVWRSGGRRGVRSCVEGAAR